MSNTLKVGEVASHLLDAKNIILTTHMTPDGDGLGSELAMLRYLRSKGKNVTILNCSTVPEDLRFLLRSGEIVTFQKGKHEQLLDDCDLIVAFDLGAAGRLGRMEGPVRNCEAKKMLVDHHIFDNDLFDLLFLDTEVSSSAELTHSILVELGMPLPIDVSVAEPLYVGIIQDTGSFNFNTTTPNSMRLAATFVEAGVNTYRIWRKLNCQKKLGRVRFMGLNISRIETICDGRLATVQVDLDFLRKNKGETRDAFEVVNHLLTIAGVEVGCFALQLGSDKVKFSLRSSGRHNVCNIAKEFGGGGHRFAAGFTTQGMPMAQALGLAAKAGALMVTRLGTADVIPDLAEVREAF
jgi:phosphoesterase RecJ-like protein